MSRCPGLDVLMAKVTSLRVAVPAAVSALSFPHWPPRAGSWMSFSTRPALLAASRPLSGRALC